MAWWKYHCTGPPKILEVRRSIRKSKRTKQKTCWLVGLAAFLGGFWETQKEMWMRGQMCCDKIDTRHDFLDRLFHVRMGSRFFQIPIESPKSSNSWRIPGFHTSAEIGVWSMVPRQCLLVVVWPMCCGWRITGHMQDIQATRMAWRWNDLDLALRSLWGPAIELISLRMMLEKKGFLKKLSQWKSGNCQDVEGFNGMK